MCWISIAIRVYSKFQFWTQSFYVQAHLKMFPEESTYSWKEMKKTLQNIMDNTSFKIKSELVLSGILLFEEHFQMPFNLEVAWQSFRLCKLYHREMFIGYDCLWQMLLLLTENTFKVVCYPNFNKIIWKYLLSKFRVFQDILR